MPARIERRDRVGRRRTEIIKRAFDGPYDAFHIAVCEDGCNEADDFSISRVVIAVDELNGVVYEMFFLGKIVEEMIEVVLEGGHKTILAAFYGLCGSVFTAVITTEPQKSQNAATVYRGNDRVPGFARSVFSLVREGDCSGSDVRFRRSLSRGNDSIDGMLFASIASGPFFF